MPFEPFDATELEKELEKEIADLDNINSNLLDTLVQYALTEIGEVDDSLKELVNKLVVSSIGLALEKLEQIREQSDKTTAKMKDLESKRQSSDVGKKLNDLLSKTGVDYDSFLRYINEEMSVSQQNKIAQLPLEMQVESVLKLMRGEANGTTNFQGKLENIDDDAATTNSIFERE